MGGRLPVTMHGALGWFLGNHAKPQIKAAGREARRDYSFAWVGHRRRRRRPRSLSGAGTGPCSAQKPPLPPKR